MLSGASTAHQPSDALSDGAVFGPPASPPPPTWIRVAGVLAAITIGAGSALQGSLAGLTAALCLFALVAPPALGVCASVAAAAGFLLGGGPLGLAALAWTPVAAILLLRWPLQSRRPTSIMLPADTRVARLPAYIWRTDAAGAFDYLDARFLRWLGVDLSGLSASEGAFDYAGILHPEDRDRCLAIWSACLRSGEPYLCEARLRGAGGNYRWVQMEGLALRTPDGDVSGWIGTVIDISHMRREEASFDRVDPELAAVLDSLPAMIWIADTNVEVTFLNRRLLDSLGIASDDLLEPGRSRFEVGLQRVIHPDDAPTVAEGFARAMSGGEPFSLRYRQSRSTGGYHWVQVRGEPFRTADGRITHWYGVALDIHKEVEAEAALRKARDAMARSTRLASLSVLSASTAHEVSQPLSAARINVQAGLTWLSGDPPNAERATQAFANAIGNMERAAAVLGRIRGLVTPETVRRAHSLAELVDEAVTLLGDDLREAEAVLEIQHTAPDVTARCDRIQVQQVLVNLLKNAVEALLRVDGPRRIGVATRQVGAYAEIAVEDGGPGAPDLDDLFEPFATTKPDGMGMGLAISRSIARAHDGDLIAEPGRDAGLRLVLKLPLAAPPTAADSA